LVPSTRLLTQVGNAAWGEGVCFAQRKLRVSPKHFRSVLKKNKNNHGQSDDCIDGPTGHCRAVFLFLLTGRLYWLFGRYSARSIKMSVCGSEPNCNMCSTT